MSRNYRSVPLGTVCKLHNGRAYSRSELLAEGPTRVLRVGNFFTNQNWYYSDLTLDRDKYCDDGDLLYAWSASFGPRIWNGGRVIYHYHIWKMVPDEGHLDKRYLYHFLDWDKEQIKLAQGAGATMIHVTKGSMEARHVPLPPLEDQRRIVAVLDGAFAAIATATANAEKNLANAQELFSSELRHLFRVTGAAWIRKPIGEVADARLGKMLDKAKNRGVPRPYLRNLNVRWFHFDLDDLLEMPFEESEAERYSAKRGDLLIVEGGYPGRSAIWDGEEPIFFQKAIHRVRFDDPRLAKLLMYMLFAQNGDGTLSRHFSGAGIQHLTGQALARIPMPIPPEETREQIVSKIEAMFAVSEEAQRLYEQKLGELAKLKQSLLNRAFSGEPLGSELLAA